MNAEGLGQLPNGLALVVTPDQLVDLGGRHPMRGRTTVRPLTVNLGTGASQGHSS
jgi:hypothetical protein